MTDEWAPRGIDMSMPSPARMYDYYLGGKDHFEIDRQAAGEVIARFPEVPKLARANRGFLQRAVHHLATQCGIRQFLDLGTGMPTAGNVHQVAHPVAPDTRVAYIDNDPIVLAHARALLSHANPHVTVIDADLRQPDNLITYRGHLCAAPTGMESSRKRESFSSLSLRRQEKECVAVADASMNPLDPSLTPGERIKLLRERQGMTREVLGGLVGRSGSWVKAVETGRLHTPKLPLLLRIAEALRVRDLSALTGDQSLPVQLFTGPGHPALPEVRAAVNNYELAAGAPAPSLAYLKARLARAWQARHAAPDHRSVLGGLLPELIRDARRAVRAAEDEQRRQALSVLAEVYNLAQFFVAYQPDSALLWRVAERAMSAAEESEDSLAIAGSVWLLTQAHRDAGDWDAADAINLDGVRMLEPLLPDGGDDLLAMWGALRFEAAYTAARAGRAGLAWGYWDQAKQAADRLPAGYYHPQTSFSRAIMGAHAVTVDTELRRGGESVHHAEHTDTTAIPSRPRRGRHLIEVARAHHLNNDMPAALGTLEDAHRAAPETIRYNGYARRITLELLDNPALRRQAHQLADTIGLLS